MVGPVGFEPTTPRTSSECSTSELRAYTSVLLIVFSAPATCSSGSPSGQTTTLLLQRERVVRFYIDIRFYIDTSHGNLSGAAHGNRTRLSTLGRSCSTDKLGPHGAGDEIRTRDLILGKDALYR